MNKKGFLLGEYTLKIVIAIISLLLLIYLLFTLYSNYEEERNERMAQATLDSVIEGMESAKVSSPQELTLLGGKFQGLFYFKEGEERPLVCEDSSCLCLCFKGLQKVAGWDNEKWCVEGDDTFCKKASYNLDLTKGSITLPADITIGYLNNKFTITKK